MDFCVGFLFYAVAFAFRYIADDILTGLPFVTFYLAALFAAYFLGWRVAAMVTTLSLATAWYFFIEPRRSFGAPSPQVPIQLIFFAIVSASQILLVAMLVEAIRRRDAKRIELERQRSLQQVLFQELQHRVANGMQLISSILSMQGRMLAPGSEGRLAIDVAAGRLTTLARVHRRLHDPNLGGEGIGPALRDLAQDVLTAAGRTDVQLEVDAPTLPIGPAAGTSLAMVVAEATTNALKHAFAGREGGRLAISLTEHDTRWELTITDDGPGFGPQAKPDARSLGLMIIRSMASRLGGEVGFGEAPGGGAQMWLRFSEPPAGGEGATPLQPMEQPTRRRTDRERPYQAQSRAEQA